MKLCLVLWCLPFHVSSFHIAQRDDLGKPRQGATFQVDNIPTHQPAPQSREDAHEPEFSWMSQDSRNRLQQVRAHERVARLNGSLFRTSPRFVLLRDSPTAVVYMTYRDDKFHHCQAEQLSTAFGSMFHTVSVRQLSNMPSFRPADSIVNGFLGISDEELYKLNDKINREHGIPSEGAVTLAHALTLPLFLPDIKYLWIVEDDFAFDGDSIKQMVIFHSNDDADYMVVNQRRYAPGSLWEGWKPLKKLRFHQRYWSGSFAPVMRVSTKFVNNVAVEMLEHGFCFFESFFPTVANYYGLKTTKFDDQFIKNVRWMPEWTEEEMTMAREGQAGNLSIFHPFKANQSQIIPACSA